MSLQNLRAWHDWNEEDEMKDREKAEPDSIKLVTKFGENYIRPLFVIVECYDHKKHGKGKREYLSQFSDKERKVISQYYGKLYDWYLRRGIPQDGVEMSLSTYELLCRAANFFASI